MIQKANVLIDVNDHTGAAILYVKMLPDTMQKLRSAYLTILQEIADVHELQGYLTMTQVQIRDGIASEVKKCLDEFHWFQEIEKSF